MPKLYKILIGVKQEISNLHLHKKFIHLLIVHLPLINFYF